MPASQEHLAELHERIRVLTARRDALSREIERLAALLHSLDHPAPRLDHDLPLKGLKVGVIGPSAREPDYRAIVESLGARFFFAPSEEKIGQVSRVCSKVHGVLYITTFGSHKVEDHVSRMANRLSLPVQHLRFKGLERLRQAALELAADMTAYKELQLEARSARTEPGST